MINDSEQDFNLSGEASSGTMGSIAAFAGWLLLLGLAGVTAVHAISLVQARTHLSGAGGDLFDIVRIGGVVLVELFAVVTAVMLATHKLRAKQKPMAMAVEAVWFIFAGMNLISSFAVEAGGPLPAFVGSWITYGLPVSALVIGSLFYVMLRLNPDAARADDEAELMERFARIKHGARLEVMSSPQMRAVIRQMTWQQLPPVVGRQMNLNDAQIAALVGQAPRLLDLNGNGIPDVSEGAPIAERQAGRIANAAESSGYKPGVLDRFLGRKHLPPTADPALVAAIVAAIRDDQGTPHDAPLTDYERGQVADLYEQVRNDPQALARAYEAMQAAEAAGVHYSSNGNGAGVAGGGRFRGENEQ